MKDEIVNAVAGVCSVLVDLEQERSKNDKLGDVMMPARDVYMALGMDWQKWERVASVLRAGNFCEIDIETIKLLPAGRVLGKRINEAIVNQKAKAEVEKLHDKL